MVQASADVMMRGDRASAARLLAADVATCANRAWRRREVAGCDGVRETSADALVEDGALSIADEARGKRIRAKPPVVAPRPAKSAPSVIAPAAAPTVAPSVTPEVAATGVQTLAQAPAAPAQPAGGTPAAP